MQAQRLYEFGAFRLDPVERRLWRGEKGVSLAPKAFEALLALVESGGRVLERGELIKRIWPDTAAGEANLAVTISSLRKALGERPEGGLYIETVPRQGYRFAVSVKQSFGQPDDAPREDEHLIKQAMAAGAPVSIRVASPSVKTTAGLSDSGEPAVIEAAENQRTSIASDAQATRPDLAIWFAAHRKAIAMGLAIAIVVVVAGYALVFRRAAAARKDASPRRLAILPFRNLKPDAQTDFLGFSLADATITKLGYVGSLVVRPSSYVDKYRGQDVEPKQVAAELNVDTLMTGTFLKEGNNLRITVQLIDVKKGEILSIFPLDIKYDKLLTVQDQVAQNILDRLQLELTAAEAERLNQKGTENLLAYEYFLRGTDLYARNEFISALLVLEKTVEMDPNFALAWAHLGRAYNACASFNLKGSAHYHKAQAAYEQALALNPDLIEATIFMANLFTDTNRVEQAVPLLRKLVDANPNLAEARWELGYAYRFAGMLKASIEEGERARVLDPKVKLNSSAFNSYLYTGQYVKFIDSLPAGDSSAFIVFYRGLGNYYLKNVEQAAADFDRAYTMEPQLYTRIGKALSYAIRNQKPVALEVLRDVEQQIEQSEVGDAEGIYKVAEVYSVLGDKPSALRVLRRSIENGFFCYDYFKSDPLLDNLRSEPAFNALLETARTRQEQFKRTFF
jgi:DNA-binding winged helix-turn-helix (wHTH) protein/TolB-like protein